MSKQQTEYVDVARLAFWSKTSKSGTPFLSGFIEFADGSKVNCRLFKAQEKRNENSPDFFGSGSVPEDDVSLDITLDEYERQEKKPAKKQPAKTKRTRKFEDDEPPF